jgi:DNA modification methylase
MNIYISQKANVIFADYVYENLNFSWIDRWWETLYEDGLFIAMTDYHSVFELGVKLKSMPDATFVNHLVWKNEWGNHPKDRFHQCFDDIVIFCKGKNWKFYSDRVQVEKATVNTKLNPSGRQTKTATAFISDICLTTTSKERIKMHDGHLIKWQKPLGLMDRIFLPFTNDDDMILDLFMGSATAGEWALKNNRNYIGIENDSETFLLANERLSNLDKIQ